MFMPREEDLPDMGHSELAEALDACADWNSNRDPALSALLKEVAQRVRALDESGPG